MLRRPLILTAFVFAPLVANADGNREFPLADGKTIVFLGQEEGREAIVESTHDPFLNSLSHIDAELRLAEPLPDASAEQRLLLLEKLFRDSVQPWNDVEMRTIAEACQTVFHAAQRVSPDFIPDRWKFVKTDGSEEAQAAYTRHDAIILPTGKINPAVADRSAGSRYRLAKLVAHETSHVFSRLHPNRRERLYRRLGFENVGPIALGDYLESRRITNPDGVAIEHVIRVSHPQAGQFPATLVTYSKSDRFAPAIGRRIFDYLQFGLFEVEQTPTGYRVVTPRDGQPRSYAPDEVTGFFEQVGRNTRYLIHPDEILADNLALLLTEGHPGGPATAPPDQKLLRDLATLLRGRN